VKMSRAWAMPSGETFSIPPINNFVKSYNKQDLESCDPFANNSRFAKYNNDIDPKYKTEFNMDALEFLKTFESSSIDLVLFDPPYSPRQVSECYKSLNKTVNMETTQSSFWSNIKNEIFRVVKPEGTVLSFGWNSQGIGKKRGFIMEEILIVAHGGNHNDTICTAERKALDLFSL